MTLRILHIAPLNVAGVPFAMMSLQRRFGHTARLVTLHRSPLTFPEDICLDLPLPRGFLAGAWRRSKSANNHSASPSPPVLKPHNVLERLYFRLDDAFRDRTVQKAVREHELESFDIIHYDGGLDFYRDARMARMWKRRGKKIVCHYHGSDLRVRGLHSDMDRISDLNLTNETDHLLLHQNIQYIPIPFDPSPLPRRSGENKVLRIVHSPTNRAFKGTNEILAALERLQKVRTVEVVLLERLPHHEVLRIKQTCDIAIEQVGNSGGTGYGRNSLETLSMGIPTITDMTAECQSFFRDHPFILATPETLFDRLIELVDDPALRHRYADAGRPWVERNHSLESVYFRLLDLYRSHGII